MMIDRPSISVVIPAKSEAATIAGLVEEVRTLLPAVEIIVVSDGSTDATADLARNAGAHVVSHPTCLGNGAAIKAGARSAKGDILVFMDADGQHKPADIPRLLKELDQGYQMAVGARNVGSHANLARLAANGAYNVLASAVTGHRIPDLTSGFRAVKADLFRKFIYLLPNGFSYPTTITMALMRAGHAVAFVEIAALKRKSRSHISPLKDGFRFLIIIFKIATLYSPLKIFLPVSGLFFVLGVGYYAYTFFAFSRFTNMSLLLLSISILIFLMGLLSEQVTTVIFRD